MTEYSDDFLRDILTRTRTIAIVGVSANTVRPSFYVARYLGLKGFRIVPVNPGLAGQELFGQQVHASLADIPADIRIDMVDIFRRSEAAGPIVDDALEQLAPRGLKTIWMQIGIINEPAAERARAAGLDVVMNRCPKIEYQRLFGELRMGGFATGLVTSKLDPR
jgi:predicted CoA-binding protein